MRPPVRILLVMALLAGAFAASEMFLKPASPRKRRRAARRLPGRWRPATPPHGRQNTRQSAAGKGQRLGWLNRQRGWLARLAEDVLTVEFVTMPVVVGVVAGGLGAHASAPQRGHEGRMRPLRLLLVLLLIGGGVGASLLFVSKAARSLHGAPLFHTSPPATTDWAAGHTARPARQSGAGHAMPPGVGRRRSILRPALGAEPRSHPATAASAGGLSHVSGLGAVLVAALEIAAGVLLLGLLLALVVLAACAGAAAASTGCMSFTSRPTTRPRRRTSRTWSSRSRTSCARARPIGSATASRTWRLS